MEYLLLIYNQEKKSQNLSEEAMNKIIGEYEEFGEYIKGKGNYIGGNALKPTTTATTVRLSDGKSLITDGPFAETKEQLGGYYLVDCKDLDEAIDLARRIPEVKYGGSIEVRPIWDIG
jgi:hypothetical protein